MIEVLQKVDLSHDAEPIADAVLVNAKFMGFKNQSSPLPT
jgi:hypothetical protein